MPAPRTMYGGYGGLNTVVRVDPPGIEPLARSNRAARPGRPGEVVVDEAHGRSVAPPSSLGGGVD